MIYDIFNENRNINFVGLAKAIGELIENNEKGQDINVDKFISRTIKYSYLYGDGENQEKLCDELAKDNSVLFEADGSERYLRPLNNEFFTAQKKEQVLAAGDEYASYRMPYTKEEVIYLKRVIASGVLNFFFSKEDCVKIENNIDVYLKENGIEPGEVEIIDEFLKNPGQSKLRENWYEIRDKYHTLTLIDKRISFNKKGAVKAGFKYMSGFAGENKLMEVYPLEILYSQLEERIRIKVWIPKENRYERIYLSDISDYEEVNSKTAVELEDEEEWAVLFAVRDTKNAYERFVGRIQEYEYDFLPNPNKDMTDIYYIKVRFPSLDKYRMLNRILSVGPNLRVIDEKKIITAVRKACSGKKREELKERFESDEAAIIKCGKEMKQMVITELKKSIL